MAEINADVAMGAAVLFLRGAEGRAILRGAPAPSPR